MAEAPAIRLSHAILATANIRAALIFIAAVAVACMALPARNIVAALVFMAVVLLGPGVFKYVTGTELAVEDERLVVRTSRKHCVVREQWVPLDVLSGITVFLFQPNRRSYGIRLCLFARGAERPDVIIMNAWRTAEDREDFIRRLRELLGEQIPYNSRVLPDDYATFKRKEWIKP